MLGRCISAVIESSAVFRTNREVVLKVFFKGWQKFFANEATQLLSSRKVHKLFFRMRQTSVFLSSTKLLCYRLHIFIYFPLYFISIKICMSI